jgi:two-component system chemotaxis response regulator CheB
VVAKGPKDSRFHPSIDALFRSAASAHVPGAIGVILSGALDDGTSGLWSIKRCGGVAVVQQPSQAQVATMPRSTLAYVAVDHVLPAVETGAVLGRLVQQLLAPSGAVDAALTTRLATEIQIAAENGAFQKGVMTRGPLTPFTCPECHGILVQIAEDKLARLRCHTGHAYSDSALLAAVMEAAGDLVWQVMRGFEEAVMLLTHMGEHMQAAGEVVRAETFFAKARELEQRLRAFHGAALQHESLSGENLGHPPPGQASRRP